VRKQVSLGPSASRICSAWSEIANSSTQPLHVRVLPSLTSICRRGPIRNKNIRRQR